ncbi:MAG: MBL fold metallo-hydrolase [Flavobacteriaceae bacterium]|nr:MBL fold metallo-hydrolase [Flavobacteriaceae bacterium]
MKLTFLGTGTSKGIPVIGSKNEVCLSIDKRDKRLRSSVLISWNSFNYVIDCGPDFRIQMLRANISKIDGVLYTHEHADHTAGLDDIRPFTQKYGDLPLYAKKRVLKNLKKRFDYIFTTKGKYPSAPSALLNIVKNKPFKLGDLQVIPIKVLHGKLSIFGYRFDEIVYLTDVSSITNSEKEKLKSVTILVINAFRITKHPTHFNLEQALQFIKEVSPEKAYITHISHQLGFHATVEKILPKNVFLAYDGLEVSTK